MFCKSDIHLSVDLILPVLDIMCLFFQAKHCFLFNTEAIDELSSAGLVAAVREKPDEQSASCGDSAWDECLRMANVTNRRHLIEMCLFHFLVEV